MVVVVSTRPYRCHRRVDEREEGETTDGETVSSKDYFLTNPVKGLPMGPHCQEYRTVGTGVPGV